jgi:5,10-methylenetetrahydromethanopterin reductase
MGVVQMRIGLFVGVSGPITFAEALAYAQEAERAELDSFWLPNIFALEALTTLAAIGARTARIELGTNVVPVYPRHPMVLAQQALTASVLTGGRLTLGVGLSHKFFIEGMLGLSFDSPSRYMREYLSILQPMLAGEVVQFDGSVLHAAGQLTVSDAYPVPVLVAAMGPHMLRLAGAHSGGTLLGWAGAKNVREYVAPAIRAAAEQVGRPAPRISTALPICVTDGVDAAYANAGQLFALYNDIPSYRTILDREGKATVADVALIGNEDQVREQLAELADAGVTDFAAVTFGTNDEFHRTMALLTAARRD